MDGAFYKRKGYSRGFIACVCEDARIMDAPMESIKDTEIFAFYYGAREAQQGDTIISDAKGLVDTRNKEPKKKEHYFIKDIRKLIAEKELKIMWMPREGNLAGVFLEAMRETMKKKI